MSNTKKKPSTRERIIAQAGRLTKQQGFATVGVDALMAAADMQGGSFYYHFAKKENLLGAIIAVEISQSRQRLTHNGSASKKHLLQRLLQYVSEAHVEQPEEGCVIPSLSNEVARASQATRTVYASEVQAFSKDIEDILGHNAWPVIAMCVGAVTMARAMPRGETRTAILAQCSAQLKQAFAQTE